jgi:hypothetical protein
MKTFGALVGLLFASLLLLAMVLPTRASGEAVSASRKPILVRLPP